MVYSTFGSVSYQWHLQLILWILFFFLPLLIIVKFASVSVFCQLSFPTATAAVKYVRWGILWLILWMTSTMTEQNCRALDTQHRVHHLFDFFLSLQSSTTMIEKIFHAIFVCHLLIFNMWLPRQLRRTTEVMALVEQRKKCTQVEPTSLRHSWWCVCSSRSKECRHEKCSFSHISEWIYETQQIRSYNVLLCHLKNASCRCKPKSHKNVSRCTALIVCRKYTTSTSGKIFGIQTFIALIRSIWSHVKMLDDRAAAWRIYTMSCVSIPTHTVDFSFAKIYKTEESEKKPQMKNEKWKIELRQGVNRSDRSCESTKIESEKRRKSFIFHVFLFSFVFRPPHRLFACLLRLYLSNRIDIVFLAFWGKKTLE